MYGTPVATAIDKLLHDGKVDLARAVFRKAVDENLFQVDGHVNLYDKIACVELFQLHDLGGRYETTGNE